MRNIKYLLTPITMYLWYLLTYYGFYLAFAGMMFVFSLNWVIIFSGYLFLIGLLHSIFISVPSLLRYIILKFYGLSWFNTIAHLLAGLYGIISIGISLKNNSLLIYEGNNSIFFLAWMWEASPLKTIFLFIPFLALTCGLVWSVIIFPIQMQFIGNESDIRDVNVPDNEELRAKAEELVDSSRILFAVIRPRLLQKFPELYIGKDLEKLNLFGTIASSYLVCIHLHHEVEKGKRTELELIVQKNIKDLYEGALDYYEDLHIVIQRKILEENDRKKRRTLIHYLACLWILNQIGLIKNIDTPYEKAVEIATQLSAILENETAGYWSRK